MTNLPASIAAALEIAINRYIALDPDARQSFVKLVDRVLRVELIDLDVCFYLLPARADIQILGSYQGKADTTITGSCLALLRMQISQSSTDSLFSGDIKISGDMDLGQDFQTAFSHIDIDWEEHLSKISGDVVAHKVGNLLRDALQWGEKTINNIKLDVADYLHYESKELPTRDEIEAFIEGVDCIRSDVDRIEARVKRLISKNPPAKKSDKKKKKKV